ncbi:hypothetical protein BKA70DRAFT_1227045 [Coprinopsis sp. MPI-PUGE-AT-0042]|nr:hypothetical protein BKA70DRAFT_1227045 [Coprinopsis sp. MPI-PUGE-AT-0042]
MGVLTLPQLGLRYAALRLAIPAPGLRLRMVRYAQSFAAKSWVGIAGSSLSLSLASSIMPKSETSPTTNQILHDDPLFKCGQYIARSIHPYIYLNRIIPTEVKIERSLEEDQLRWQEMHEKDREDHRLYLLIKDAILSAGEDIVESTVAVQGNILDLVTKGQTFALRVDLAQLKQKAPDWLASYGFPFDAEGNENSLMRGFESDLIGGLLCPVSLDWLDPERTDTWLGFTHLIHALTGAAVSRSLRLCTRPHYENTYVKGSRQAFFELLSRHLRSRSHHDEAQLLIEWWQRRVLETRPFGTYIPTTSLESEHTIRDFLPVREMIGTHHTET